MLILLFPVFGCREKPPSQFDRNKAPETFLTSAPAESSLSFYRAHLYWAGFDKDGYVAHYQWAVTDSQPSDPLPWNTTLKTDSVFVFPVKSDAQIVGRRFYVRAIDNEGKRDETPAWAFFINRDAVFPEVFYTQALGAGTLLSPQRDTTVTIRSTNEITPTDTIPAINNSITFRWTGVDRDTIPGERVGRVVAFRHKLNTREIDWVGGTLADTSASYTNLSSGVHVLYVQAIDEAGLATDSHIKFESRRSVVANFDPQTWYMKDANGRILFDADNGSEHHVEGDTLLGGIVRSITARVSSTDRDGTVDKIQYRVDGDNWRLSTTPGNTEVEVGSGSLPDGDHRLQARGVDNLGRPDGTPANLKFVIGFKPVFQTSGTFQNIAFVQYPQEGDTVYVDHTGSFTVRFYATDVENNLVKGYATAIDDGPLSGDDQPLAQPDPIHSVPIGGYYMTFQLPEETDNYHWGGWHKIVVRARDSGNTWGYTKNPRCEDHYNAYQDRCDWEQMRVAGTINFFVVKQTGAAAGRSMYR